MGNRQQLGHLPPPRHLAHPHLVSPTRFIKQLTNAGLIVERKPRGNGWTVKTSTGALIAAFGKEVSDHSRTEANIKAQIKRATGIRF